MRDAGEIERAVAAFPRRPEWRSDPDGECIGGGVDREPAKIALAAKQTAAVDDRTTTSSPLAGPVSDGHDVVEQFRGAAGYVDRILKARSRPTCRYRHERIRVGDQSQDRQGARPRPPSPRRPPAPTRSSSKSTSAVDRWTAHDRFWHERASAAFVHLRPLLNEHRTLPHSGGSSLRARGGVILSVSSRFAHEFV